MKTTIAVLTLFMSHLPLITNPATAAGQTEEAERDIFRARCVGCHAVGCNRLGPKLRGVIGRKAGSASGFTSYSEALKQSQLTWTEETLDIFLKDPNKLVPGTAMASAGRIESSTERQMLLRLIKRGDTSLDLCP
jgi:cytochrome c